MQQQTERGLQGRINAENPSSEASDVALVDVPLRLRSPRGRRTHAATTEVDRNAAGNGPNGTVVYARGAQRDRSRSVRSAFRAPLPGQGTDSLRPYAVYDVCTTCPVFPIVVTCYVIVTVVSVECRNNNRIIITSVVRRVVGNPVARKKG